MKIMIIEGTADIFLNTDPSEFTTLHAGQMIIQPLNATDPAPFQSDQSASNRAVSSPSDQRWESMTPSQRACRRSRSRASKPMAN